MKKEKQVRSYKRRTKSGRTVTVKAHTAKYEAADEKAKEVSKKPGAGKELEERKKKPVQLELPFDKEEEKKVLDEVKGEEKTSTSKKSKKSESSSKESKPSFTTKYYVGLGGYTGSKNAKKAKYAVMVDADAGAEAEIAKKYGKDADYKSPQAAKIYDKWHKKADKILSELKGTSETKKVRPVGSGTNGPTPKKKSETKGATDGISKSSGAEITKAIGEKRAHLLFEKALDKGSASVRKGGVKYTISIEDRKDGTYAVYTKQGGSSKTKSSAPIKTSVKTTSASASSPAFTAAEFKEWYRGTGSAADKKVAKALRAQLGRSGYRKLEDEAIDNYSSRGHLSMFKRVSGGSGTSTKTAASKGTSTSTTGKKEIKMPDKVREKKRKTEEYLRKVKESGMSLDEYNRLH